MSARTAAARTRGRSPGAASAARRGMTPTGRFAATAWSTAIALSSPGKRSRWSSSGTTTDGWSRSAHNATAAASVTTA
jgi:hypothetical protein